MKRSISVITHLLRFKSGQVRRARECALAAEKTNGSLSAYLAILIDGMGEVRIPAKTVSGALGHYRATVRREGDDYVIGVVGLHGRGVSDGEESV